MSSEQANMSISVVRINLGECGSHDAAVWHCGPFIAAVIIDAGAMVNIAGLLTAETRLQISANIIRKGMQ